MTGTGGDNEQQAGSVRLAPAAADNYKFDEILVQPYTNVRLKCQLPNESSLGTSPTGSDADKSGSWMFQPSSRMGPSRVPLLLFFKNMCYACSDPVELDMNLEQGTYDLVINNITYEANDGVYQCNYKDTNKPSKQPKQLQIYKLTVLSKYRRSRFPVSFVV